MTYLRKECGLVVLLLCTITGISLGAEWKAVNTGLTNMDIRSLAIDPANSLTVYAGTGNGVFKSSNGGASWQGSGLADGATTHLVIDFANPNILYAGTACTGVCFCSERLLFKSTDGGASWSNSISPPDQACDIIRALVMDPSDTNTLYIAASGLSGFPPLLKSTDGGATWNYLPPWRYPSLGHFEDVLAVAINPLAPNILYAGSWDFPDPSGLLRSTDGGTTWSKTGLVKPTVTALAIDPLNPSTLYALAGSYLDEANQGPLKSTDSGASWFAIDHGLSDFISSESHFAALVIDPRNPNTLYTATTGNGVFKTSDGGASWLRFNDGLTNSNVQTLALAPGASGQNILYAGTAGGGIFKSLDDGVASDPVPVSRTFFVPVIVSAPGIGGAFYESELTLANRSGRDATVELTYTAAFGGGGGQARTTLEAGRQRIAPDAVAYLRQLGIPIPESGSRGGTLRVRFYGLPSPDEGAVFVRTTTAVTEGRAGVAYPGVPMSLLGGFQALYGLRQDASYRTNLALQNAGEAQDGDITLRVYVFASNSAAEFPEILLHQVIPPGGFYQINDILHSHGLEISNGHVSLGRISGYAPFYAYAVMHNRASPDAIYVPPASQSLSRLTIPTVPRRQDGFKSELVLKYPANSLEDQSFSISFQAVEQETFPVKAEITLKPNEQRIVSDVESWLKDFGLAIRQRPFLGVKGPLVFTKERVGGDQNAIPLSLGMRVSTLNNGEEYSLFFPAVPAEQESRAATWLFGLQQNAETRTNLAIVNLGNEPNRFTIELFDGKTGNQVGRVDGVTVNPQGSFQLNSLLADYAPGVAQSYARVIPSNTEPFVTYAVIIDGARPGERTGDGSLVHSSP